jgi:hypothetical protein
MPEELLLDIPHRQVVFVIPKMLRIFFKYNRRLLGDLCRCGLRSMTRYFEIATRSELMRGGIAAIQTFGNRINFHPHLHLLVTESGVDEAGLFHKMPRIDDSRLAELFAREVLTDLTRNELLSPEGGERILFWRHTRFNVHSRVRAKTKIEAERVGKGMIRPIPAKGWAEMIRKVYEVDPLTCVKCGGTMKIIAFLADYAVVDRIIDHLKLTFVADKPPPACRAYQEVLMAAETGAEYFS